MGTIRAQAGFTRRLWRCAPCFLLAGGLWGSACSNLCQSVGFRPLELRCNPATGFSGEVHFDSRANLETFLRSQCLLPDDDARINATLDEVDFSREAVFVAVRPMNTGNGACLRTRAVDEVDICDDGLHITFADEYFPSGDACPNGNWTVAFILSRDDLRTALRLVADD